MGKEEKDVFEGIDVQDMENTADLLLGLEEMGAVEYTLEEILAEFATEKPQEVDIRQPWVNAGEKPQPIVLHSDRTISVDRVPSAVKQQAAPGKADDTKADHKTEKNETRQAPVILLDEHREPREQGEDRAMPPASMPDEPGDKTKPRKGFLCKRAKAGEGSTPEEEGPAQETEMPEACLRNASMRGLFEKMDSYAEDMYDDAEHEDEQTEQDAPEDARSARGGKTRKGRRKPDPEPQEEVPPEIAAKEYAKGLNWLKLRILLVFMLCLPMCYLILWDSMGLPMPAFVADNFPIKVFILLALQTATVLLGMDVLVAGLYDLIRLRPGAETAVAISCIASMVDAATMLTLTGRGENAPYCTLSAFALFFTMWGIYLRRRGMKDTCKAAAASADPYVVFLAEEGGFMKRQGDITGFMTGVESPDGAQKIFGLVLPLVLLAALIFSVLASVGQDVPYRFFWCYAAMMSAAASFSGVLAFGLPFAMLAHRLMQSGAALSGWDGACTMGEDKGIVLTEGDLFPVGTVALNGIKVFGDYSVETVTSYAAGIIAASGCGLKKTFSELLRAQGGTLRKVDHFSFYEDGGFSAEIQGETVIMGSSDFMALMGVSLPKGMKLKSGVFVAIGGLLAGVFAINYTPGESIRGALISVLRNKLSPILAVRDFNITPSMLSRKFKMSAFRGEYPPIQQRLERSELNSCSEGSAAAVLCREGLVPFADAVIGGRRLRTAVYVNTIIASVGCVFGVLMGFYLTFIAAYDAISPANLLAYMVMWTIPTFLISGWVNRY